MTPVKISIAVMAHPDRAKEADKLFRKLGKFYSRALVFDKDNNEWNTGVEALHAHTDSDYHVIIQDDAIIGPKFFENVFRAILYAPQNTALSFYTGKVRPFPKRVATAVATARNVNASYLQWDRLGWGVCFSLPTYQIDQMLGYVKGSSLPFDQRISLFYNRYKLPVFYTNPSLVNHDYKLGSLIKNDYNQEPRVAHYFEPEEVEVWNERVVQI